MKAANNGFSISTAAGPKLAALHPMRQADCHALV
jgi:hypothetical protein